MENLPDILKNLDIEEKHVFNLIQKKGPLTKNEIVINTDLKLTTLNRIMESLRSKALIGATGIGESTGGRKPVYYDVNKAGFFTVGIDISRTYTQIVISNLKAEILSKMQYVMDSHCTPEFLVKRIANTAKNLIEKAGVNLKDFIGAGVGTIGPIDRDAGIMLDPENFPAPGWENVPIMQMLQKELEVPVFIDNGANTAVLAEYLYGDGKRFKNLAYFNCGIGIRVGAVSSGAIVRTVNNSENAFAHTVVDINGRKCKCGNYGCIECYSSIYSICNNFRSKIEEGAQTTIVNKIEEISFMDICKAAEENDSLSREIIINAAVILAVGLANYINLLNPDMIVLSGPLTTYSKLFYDTCLDTVSCKVYMKESNHTKFSKGGSFGDNAISIGAAAMVSECLLGNRVVR